MFDFFNSVIKGARNLPITALVQLTFFRLNRYFVARREQGYNILASNEQYTPYVDAKRHIWLKLDHLRSFFKITTKDDFMSSQREVEHITSTYMTINTLVVRHLYMNFPVVILQ